ASRFPSPRSRSGGLGCGSRGPRSRVRTPPGRRTCGCAAWTGSGSASTPEQSPALGGGSPVPYAGAVTTPHQPQWQPMASPPAPSAYLQSMRPAPAPAELADYHLLLRGPRRAWWRPIVSFLLVLGGLLGATIALIILMVVGWAVSGADLANFDELSLDFNNPVTFAGQ